MNRSGPRDALNFGYGARVKRHFDLLVFLVLAYGAAYVGRQFEPGLWYAALEKSSLNPPNWVFAPVWTLLYACMAVAATWVWRAQKRIGPLLPWAAQLVLNAVWSWIFFGLHRPGWALLEMGVLWLTLLATILVFRPLSRAASNLLLPYLAWVTFAAWLNASVWWLNP